MTNPRLDWRFLLPDPDLGVVAIGGSPDEDLLAALTASATAVVDGPPAGSADLLVARDPAADALTDLVARVRPDGAVYVEAVRSALHPGWVRAWGRSLAAAGVRDVEAYWLVPDARALRLAVPLSRPGAARAVIGRAATPAKALAAGLVVRLAASSGVLPLMTAEVAFIGVRGAP